VNQTVPEIVRIGVANARIKCVTPQRVEYRDEAGRECFVELISVSEFRSNTTTRKKASLSCGR